MKFSEHALCFSCAGEELVGIVSVPEVPQPVGVLVLVGGPQYRVGSHRQFLLLARALCETGYPVMRFDYRGMGDSTGELRDFEAVNEDIAAAIDVFRQQCPNVSKIVLWGLCDAASASLLYCDAKQDQRVAGLVLLNPWVRSEFSLAKTHIKHYYGQRLIQADFWRKLLSGKLGLRQAMGGVVESLKRVGQQGAKSANDEMPVFQKKMVRGLQGFGGQVLILLSGNDYTAKEFVETIQADEEWANCLKKKNIMRIEIPGADHTFSSAEWRTHVENATRQWLGKRASQ